MSSTRVRAKPLIQRKLLFCARKPVERPISSVAQARVNTDIDPASKAEMCSTMLAMRECGGWMLSARSNGGRSREFLGLPVVSVGQGITRPRRHGRSRGERPMPARYFIVCYNFHKLHKAAPTDADGLVCAAALARSSSLMLLAASSIAWKSATRRSIRTLD